MRVGAVVGLFLADLRGLKRRFARMEIIEWCFDVDGGMRVGAVVGLFLADLRGLKRGFARMEWRSEIDAGRRGGWVGSRRFARMVWCSEIDVGRRGGWVGSRRFARIETQICADGDNRVVF